MILWHKIYSCLWWLCFPFLLLDLCYRAYKDTEYLRGAGSRFGFFSRNICKKNNIWLHAASLGEVKAALPLLKYLLTNYSYQIIVTTMTLTGAQCVRQEFSSEPRVRHEYLPYDTDILIVRFLKSFLPKICFILETEIWPSLIYNCAQRNIPLILLNARISNKSYPRYKKTKIFFKSYLQKFTMIFAQSQIDYQRFIDLGAAAEKTLNIGNLKFDLTIPKDLPQHISNLQQYLQNKFVLIAASTHSGEEELILQEFAKLRVIDNLVLIIVPRHPERFTVVEKLLVQQRQNFICKTQIDYSKPMTANIILGNTMGELLQYYAVADLCLVGGSLLKNIGGHNLLEPAMLQKPILTGNDLSNFAELSQKLIAAQGVVIVYRATELHVRVLELYHSAVMRAKLAENAYQVILGNAGTLMRIVNLLQPYLKK